MLLLLTLILLTYTDITHGLTKQETILDNFLNFFPFLEVSSLIDNDVYDNIIYDCSLLDLSSPQCELDCQYYNDIRLLYDYITNYTNDNLIDDSLLINISSWYSMSSSSFNYYDVGNPLMCSYYYGTYCYTPITIKYDITLYQHGCCIPGSCINDDAIKVLKNNIFCFESYNNTYYKQLYGNENISIFGYDLETNLNIKCTSNNDKSYNTNPFNSANDPIWILLVTIILFSVLICIASIIHYKVDPDEEDTNSFLFIADNVSNQDSKWIYFVNIFSIQNNWYYLVNGDRNNFYYYKYLDGIRVLSFIWILFGASTQIYAITGLNDIDAKIPINILSNDTNRSSVNWSHYITSSLFSVFTVNFGIDTFFYLSGFLGILSLHKILRMSIINNDDNNGGCLESLCSCCSFKFCKMILFFLNAYIRRYLRLMPMILFIMLFTWALLDYLPSSSYHAISLPSLEIYKNCCSHNFWQNILLIKNFYVYNLDYDNNYTNCLFGCMSHLWYVCCDFQLYLLVPLLIYTYHKIYNGEYIAIISNIIIIVIGIFLRLFFGFYYNFESNFIYKQYNTINDHSGDQIFMSFNKPWSRICCYYFGSLTMLIFIYIDELSSPLSGKIDHTYYTKTQNWIKKFYLKKYQFYLIQSAVIVLIAIILFVPYNNTKDMPDDHWNKTQNIIYYAFSEPAWGLSLSLLIFSFKYRPENTDNKSLRNNSNNYPSADDVYYDSSIENDKQSSIIIIILSGIVYQILSPLIYIMYLIHFFILKWWSLTLNESLSFNTFNIINLTISMFAISFIISLVFWLIIEKPIANLIKFILSWIKLKENIYRFKVESRYDGRKRRKKKRKNNYSKQALMPSKSDKTGGGTSNISYNSTLSLGIISPKQQSL